MSYGSAEGPIRLTKALGDLKIESSKNEKYSKEMIYLLKSGIRVWVAKEEDTVGVLIGVFTNPSPQYITFKAEDIDRNG
ncbi:MAG: hypothetical protein EBY22_13565 [Gammaproteobacteria bacterium]|nr:hypothetical protein [Gammaproteobacteria bacterium]